MTVDNFIKDIPVHYFITDILLVVLLKSQLPQQGDYVKIHFYFILNILTSGEKKNPKLANFTTG